MEFERNADGSLAYTKEGAHSKPRICFHEDITGEEITTRLLSAVKQLNNVTIFEHTTMTDIIEDINHACVGILAKCADGEELEIYDGKHSNLHRWNRRTIQAFHELSDPDRRW